MATPRPYLLAALLLAALAGCSTGRIPPKRYPVMNTALVNRRPGEVAALVEQYFTERGLPVRKENDLPGRKGGIAITLTVVTDLRVTDRSVALPDVPPLFLPDTLGCDCGSMPENILIDKSGYYDNFTIVRNISIEAFDAASSLVTLDFRYDASYFRPGGYFDSKVICQSLGAREAELFKYLTRPDERKGG